MRLPALFLGHGNPMNALADNDWTRGWRAIGASIPRPRAVLCVSAHWYGPGLRVTTSPKPRTIHDFGGFAAELHRYRYPAPGDPVLARQVTALLDGYDVEEDDHWGLDHGAWAVLCHVYPDADVPVVELSIDETQPPSWHYAVGEMLAPLRDDGVLIVGSGNLVHNLHAYAWGRSGAMPFDWALRFEAQARDWIARGEHRPLVGYETLGLEAKLAAPTPDHFLPLLYVLGARREGEAATFPVEGIDGGSVSMLSVRIG